MGVDIVKEVLATKVTTDTLYTYRYMLPGAPKDSASIVASFTLTSVQCSTIASTASSGTQLITL